VTCPFGAVQRALVVTIPVWRSSDCFQLVVVPAVSENGVPPSENVSVDQVGMLARFCTSPGGCA
jgi:hypothetical protein